MMKTIPSLRLFVGTVGVSAIVGFSQAGAGDLTVTGNLNVDGDATSDGDLSWGLISGTTWAGTLRYFAPTTSPVAPAQLTSDATEEAAFTWNDLVAGSNVHYKMRLDEDNILTLYKSGTGGSNTPAISFTPDSGAIKLHGTGAGIFNGSGGGVLQIDSAGKPYFPGKALFQGGIDFGSAGGTLDEEKAGYLQGILTGFGYDANASSYTDIQKFAVPGLTVSKVISTASGIYIAGTFAQNITIDSTTYLTSNGRHIVAKINSNGTLGWAKQIKTADSSGLDTFTVKSIAVNSSGSAVIGGAFTGSTTNLSSLNITSDAASNGFVIALNSSGVPQWSKAISSSTSTEETVDGVAIDSSGNVAAAGSFKNGSVDFGNGARTTAGARDAFAVKYNSSGTAAWSLPIGGVNDNDRGKAIAFGASGAVIVGGEGGNITNLDGNTYWTGNTQDAWAVSLSSSGAFQWVKLMGGNFPDDYLKGLTTDSSGNTYALVDYYWNTTNLGAGYGTGTNWPAVSFGNDTVAVSLNTSGSVRWTRGFGSAGNDRGVGISVDSANGVVLVASNFTGSTSNLPSGYNVTSHGLGDVLLAAMDASTGNMQSSTAFGSSGDDSLAAVDLWGSYLGGIMLYGTLGSPVGDYGNTHLAPGPFMILQSGGTLTTRPPSTATLAFGGGVAEGSNSTAVGTSAYASGSQSVAFGNSYSSGNNAFAAGNATASGATSSAFGEKTEAAGEWATAFGAYSRAGGDASFVAGYGTYATGAGATAFGSSSTADGDYSLAAGELASAGGISSAAFGSYTSAVGDYSLVAGCFSYAGGDFSTASGYSAYATGNFSTAFGGNVGAGGNYAFATGLGTSATSYASTVIGAYSNSSGSPTAWVASDDLFAVGNGTSSSNRSNALVVKKNGSLAAGTGVVVGTVPSGSSQVVVGVYNDTSTDSTTNHGEGVFMVGTGTSNTARKNALRVTDDGKVLIQPSGELGMGDFNKGEQP